MNDTLKSLLLGGVIGFLLSVAMSHLPFAYAAKYRAAIEECEKSLPRDQHCIVVGVKNEQ